MRKSYLVSLFQHFDQSVDVAAALQLVVPEGKITQQAVLLFVELLWLFGGVLHVPLLKYLRGHPELILLPLRGRGCVRDEHTIHSTSLLL